MPDAHDAAVVRIEFGQQIDCAAQGCDPPHSDNGEVLPWAGPYVPNMNKRTVNNHLCQWVERKVTYSPWVRISDEGRQQ